MLSFLKCPWCKGPGGSLSFESMLDIYEELKRLISGLAAGNVDYALCGGLALAVHGLPRSTTDIDMMIQNDDLERFKNMATSLGYTIEAHPMKFAGGSVEMRRFSKTDPVTGDLLSIDLIMAAPGIVTAWETRQTVQWEEMPLSVVSKEGLIELKSLRMSGTDRDDIRFLKGEPE